MLRVVLTHLLLFLLPVILLLLWNWVIQRSRPSTIAPMRWAQAVLAGAVLVLVVVFVWQGGRAPSAPPGLRYQSPQMENGQVAPGQFVPVEPAPGGARQ